MIFGTLEESGPYWDVWLTYFLFLFFVLKMQELLFLGTMKSAIEAIIIFWN